MPYNFAYAVKDQYNGNDFSHNEDSDGKNVMGTYSVQLPDGRKQTVSTPYQAYSNSTLDFDISFLFECVFCAINGNFRYCTHFESYEFASLSTVQATHN